MILEPINLQPDAAFAETGQSNGQIHQFKEDYRPITRGQYKGQYQRKDNWRARISAEDYGKLDSREKHESPKQAGPDARIGRGKTLSKEEADQLFEPFSAALMDFGVYADKGLRLSTPLSEDEDIWGNLTADEAESLAKPLLQWGQRSPEVAFAVRTAVHVKDYAALLVIIGPRVMRTEQVIRQARALPKRPRRKFTFFRPKEPVIEADDQRSAELSPESV